MQPRPEGIGSLPFIDEQGHLRIAHCQLRAVLDFEIRHWVAIGQYAIGFLGPVNDVNKLFLDEIHKCHDDPP